MPYFVAVIEPMPLCPLIPERDVPAFAAALGVVFFETEPAVEALAEAIELTVRPRSLLLAAAGPGAEWAPDDADAWVPGAIWGMTLVSKSGEDLCRVLVQRFAGEAVPPSPL